MTTIKIKDADNNEVYLSGTGAGSSGDPFIPTNIVSGSVTTTPSGTVTVQQASTDNVSTGLVAGANELAMDAWGKQKVINDYSMFHGIWTYNVPNVMWKELLNDVELLAVNNATSSNSALSLISTTGNTSTLRSKRHPRYQPNRGQLFSAACWFPTENEADTVRDFGLSGPTCAVMFRVKNNLLYFVRMRLGVEEVEQLLDTSGIAGFDITKGHLYDIQFQWRGVGNYKVFVDQQLVYTDTNLGILGESKLPTICNPAIPVHFETTGDAEIRCSCIDVTSEGGGQINLQYRSVSTPIPMVTMNNDNDDGEAILAIKLPSTYSSVTNTRDCVLNRITTFCKDEAVTAVWFTRDPAVLGGIADNADPLLGWASIDNDSPVKYMLGGHGTLLETTFETNHLLSSYVKLLVSKRQEVDQPNILNNPDNDHESPFYMTHDDYLIVTMAPDGDAKLAGCTIEFAEEI